MHSLSFQTLDPTTPKSQDVIDFYVEHWLMQIDQAVRLGWLDGIDVANDNLAESTLIIVQQVGKIIGMRTLCLKRRELGLNLVHPDFRRQGIGFALGSRAMELLLQNGTDPISTVIASIGGAHLYEKLKKAYPQTEIIIRTSRNDPF